MTDRTLRTMSDAVTTMSKVTSANKSSFAGQRGASARGSVSARANARGSGRGAPRGALGRSTTYESSKPDFTTPAAQPQGQPAWGRGVEEEDDADEEEVLFRIEARLTAVQPRSDICMIPGFRPGLPVFVNFQLD
jgi:hypothetical protein